MSTFDQRSDLPFDQFSELPFSSKSYKLLLRRQTGIEISAHRMPKIPLSGTKIRKYLNNFIEFGLRASKIKFVPNNRCTRRRDIFQIRNVQKGATASEAGHTRTLTKSGSNEQLLARHGRLISIGLPQPVPSAPNLRRRNCRSIHEQSPPTDVRSPRIETSARKGPRALIIPRTCRDLSSDWTTLETTIS